MIGIQHANNLTDAKGRMVLWNGLWRMASDWGLGLEARGKTSSEPINDKFLMADCYTWQKIITCSRLLKTGCNNVVLLFIVVKNIVQHCYI